MSPVRSERRAIKIALLCLALTAGCKLSQQPERTGPSEDEIAKRLQRISEAAIANKNSARAVVLTPWEKLAPLLGDHVGKLVATGAPSGATDPMLTKTSKVTRGYAADGQDVTVTLSDAGDSGTLMMGLLIQHAATKVSETDAAGNKQVSTRVGPHPTLARFTPANGLAVATVAVARRFVVEVKVTAAKDENSALMIAAALPLASIAALAGEATADDANDAPAAAATPPAPPPAPAEPVDDPDLP